MKIPYHLLVLLFSVLLSSQALARELSTSRDGLSVYVPQIEEPLQEAMFADSELEFLKKLDEAEEFAKELKESAEDSLVVEYCGKILHRISTMRRVGFMKIKATRISSSFFKEPEGVLETVINDHIALREIKKDIELLNLRISTLEAQEQAATEHRRFTTTSIIAIVAVMISLLALLHSIVIHRKPKGKRK